MPEQTGWTGQDVIAVALAGNEAAMQWFALTHGIETLPTRRPTSLAGTLFGEPGPLSPAQPTIQTGALVLILIVVGAIIFLSR